MLLAPVWVTVVALLAVSGGTQHPPTVDQDPEAVPPPTTTPVAAGSDPATRTDATVSQPGTDAAYPAVLATNPLHEQEPRSVDCGPAEPFTRDAQYEHQRLSAFLACAAGVHEPAARAAGAPAADVPQLRLYTEPIETPCGPIGHDLAGWYCSGDDTIYFNLDSAAAATSEAQERYGYLTLLHEYAHHLQDRMGIFGAYTATDDEATVRRGELQAECLGALALGRVGYASEAFVTAYATAANAADQPGEPGTHGTVAARHVWVMHGLDASSYAGCNTWTAAADEVH